MIIIEQTMTEEPRVSSASEKTLINTLKAYKKSRKRGTELAMRLVRKTCQLISSSYNIFKTALDIETKPSQR